MPFLSPNRVKALKGTPSLGAFNTRGWEKLAIFDGYCRLSLKRWEIGWWLLIYYGTLIASHGCRIEWYNFRWPWVTLDPGFKVTVYLQVEFLKKVQHFYFQDHCHFSCHHCYLMEVTVVTTGTLSHINLQSNYKHHHINTVFYRPPDALSVIRPTVSMHWKHNNSFDSKNNWNPYDSKLIPIQIRWFQSKEAGQNLKTP